MKKTEETLCNDQFLQNALNRAQKSYFEKRRKLEKVFDFEKLKNEISEIKEKNVKNLEENIIFLLNSLKAKGFNVFFAKDSDEALSFFYNILSKKGVKKVVKSKSLTTEEINLNSFLEKNHITPVETDLGEWLVQLNKEKATHMTAPAIHMSKEKILNLLNKKFNVNLKLDIKEMVDFCKNEINKEFDNTNCGIFGANAVTKDGTFFIVSNEGNIQHVLNHDINICIVGIDKIVESIDEAFKIVSFLPKNATGQVITSWIDVFTRPLGDEFFVILLDNNRSKIAKEEKFDKILNCIKCGACQMACPVYTTVGGQLFRGETYAGPIGILLSYMENYNFMNELSFLCIGCMACDEVCSSRIPIQSLILEIKAKYERNNIIKKFAIKSLRNYRLLRAFIFIANPYFKNGIKMKRFKFLRDKFGLSFRTLPAINKYSFDIIKTKPSKIGLFAGCSANIFYDEVGKDLIRLSNFLNIDIEVINQSSCCGAAALYNGLKADSIIQAQKTIKDLDKFDKILFLDPHCAHMVQRDYNEFFGIDFFDRVVDAGFYFVNFLKNCDYKFTPLNKILTYHYPCHLSRGMNQASLIEEFIKEKEERFSELDEKERCCGFAGTYSIMHKHISNKLVQRKIENIIKSNSEVVITSCPGCIIQISGALNVMNNRNISVVHFISYLKNILGA